LLKINKKREKMAIAPALLVAYVAIGVAVLFGALNLGLVLGLNSKQSDDLTTTVSKETLVQSGTFLWSMSHGSQIPGASCPYGKINNVIVTNQGTGYEVGDLIVGSDPGIYMKSFIYNVSEVDESTGAVLAYESLTDGCLVQNNNITVTTMSVHGTGFEVIVDATGPTSNPNANNGSFYSFPLPPRTLVAPIQEGTYRLYTIEVRGVEMYLFEIDPPSIPIVFNASGTHTALNFYLFNFNETVGPFFPLGDWSYNVPLTPRMFNAFNLTHDGECSDCILSAYGSGLAEKNAINYGLNIVVISPAFQYPTQFLLWSYGSMSNTFNYSAHNPQFTLNKSIRWFLQPT
jgi:hypothetical protein